MSAGPNWLLVFISAEYMNGCEQQLRSSAVQTTLNNEQGMSIVSQSCICNVWLRHSPGNCLNTFLNWRRSAFCIFPGLAGFHVNTCAVQPHGPEWRESSGICWDMLCHVSSCPTYGSPITKYTTWWLYSVKTSIWDGWGVIINSNTWILQQSLVFRDLCKQLKGSRWGCNSRLSHLTLSIKMQAPLAPCV